MNKKEIIIDGVNVAGCEYMLNNKIKGKQHSPAKAMPYAKETSCICRKNIDTPYNFCKHNSNCHYKQLKRLEQENERLKVQYNCYACGNCKGKEDYINLEKHHKGLRKQFEKYYQQTLDDEIVINELAQENEELKEEILKWQTAYSRQYQINENKGYNKKEEQYRQTLQEIKAFAKDNLIGCFADKCDLASEILQIATKAEEE